MPEVRAGAGVGTFRSNYLVRDFTRLFEDVGFTARLRLLMHDGGVVGEYRKASNGLTGGSGRVARTHLVAWGYMVASHEAVSGC